MQFVREAFVMTFPWCHLWLRDKGVLYCLCTFLDAEIFRDWISRLDCDRGWKFPPLNVCAVFLSLLAQLFVLGSSVVPIASAIGSVIGPWLKSVVVVRPLYCFAFTGSRLIRCLRMVFHVVHVCVCLRFLLCLAACLLCSSTW